MCEGWINDCDADRHQHRVHRLQHANRRLLPRIRLRLISGRHSGAAGGKMALLRHGHPLLLHKQRHQAAGAKMALLRHGHPLLLHKQRHQAAGGKMALLRHGHPLLLHQQRHQLLHVLCERSQVPPRVPQHVLLLRANQARHHQLFWNGGHRSPEHVHDNHDAGPELMTLSAQSHNHL